MIKNFHHIYLDSRLSKHTVYCSFHPLQIHHLPPRVVLLFSLHPSVLYRAVQVMEAASSALKRSYWAVNDKMNVPGRRQNILLDSTHATHNILLLPCFKELCRQWEQSLVSQKKSLYCY